MDWAMMLMQPVMMVITSAVSAVAGWLTARYRSAKQDAAEREATSQSVTDACRILMGARVDSMLDSYEGYEHPTTEQTQHLIEEWSVYHGCGGDGIRTARVEKLTGMRMEEEKND